MTASSPVLIAVRSSPVHGQGAYARRRLPQGACIGVYEGRRYSAEAFLAVDWSPRPAGVTYLFGLSDSTTIDGAEGGNATRFLNHACKPNCFAQEVIDEHGTLTLQLLTLRTILPGEELFLDYALTIDERDASGLLLSMCAAWLPRHHGGGVNRRGSLPDLPALPGWRGPAFQELSGPHSLR